jgi:hypothetical protein
MWFHTVWHILEEPKHLQLSAVRTPGLVSTVACASSRNLCLSATHQRAPQMSHVCVQKCTLHEATVPHPLWHHWCLCLSFHLFTHLSQSVIYATVSCCNFFAFICIIKVMYFSNTFYYFTSFPPPPILSFLSPARLALVLPHDFLETWILPAYSSENKQKTISCTEIKSKCVV